MIEFAENLLWWGTAGYIFTKEWGEVFMSKRTAKVVARISGAALIVGLAIIVYH